jgi:DNA-binding transcriptional LysR family regulator
VLTAQGMLLRDDVERALASVRDVMDRARELSDPALRPTRVATVSAIAVGLLPHAWNMLDTASRGRLIVQTESPEMVRNAVKGATVDIGLGSLPLEHRDVTIQWMGSAPCLLAVREDDPLAREDGPVELVALRDRLLVQMSNSHGLPSRIRRALRDAGVESSSVLTNMSTHALAFVRAGVGISVVDPVTLVGAVGSGLRLLPLAKPISFHFGVVTPGVALVGARVQALSDALLATARDRLRGFQIHSPDEHQELVKQLSALEEQS